MFILLSAESKFSEEASCTFLVWFSVAHTVDEEDQDAFLDRVVCVRDVAFHLVSELLILAANFDQLPEKHTHNAVIQSLLRS